MFHVTPRARPGRYLFHDWTEARALWDRLTSSVPVHALVLMPDHVHLLTPQPPGPQWTAALNAHARWLNARHGARGPLWRPGGKPAAVPDRVHLDRLVRYIHLNPCRGRLVADPLAWPFSTHRDATGFAVPAVLSTRGDTHGFHAWVSADPSVGVRGTDLPVAQSDLEPFSFQEIAGSVSALCRVPPGRLALHGPARNLLVAAVRALTPLGVRQIAAHLGIHAATVCRCGPVPARDIRLVERVLRDVRFQPLQEGELPQTAPWHRYREHQARKRLRRE